MVLVLVRVLQRNRVSRRDAYISYKELAHTIMEAEKSPVCSRQAGDTAESMWSSRLSPKARESEELRVQVQEEPMFQFKSKGQKRSMQQFKPSFCSMQAFN